MKTYPLWIIGILGCSVAICLFIMTLQEFLSFTNIIAIIMGIVSLLIMAEAIYLGKIQQPNLLEIIQVLQESKKPEPEEKKEESKEPEQPKEESKEESKEEWDVNTVKTCC